MTQKNKEVKRRDATGHLDPEYARKLRESSLEHRSDGDQDAGFLAGPRTADALAEELGEAFIQSATSGEESEPERLEAIVPEETGGPFVSTRARDEFDYGTDASNIPEATREPLPKTSSSDP